ncbi:glycosyltransferase [Pseudochryseolinea flava]|uniref:Glycosyltransferase n=1 Tax=Pseudochryseolinea flava TaxID=2059302 RepID=A0A364XZW5_9BACT|nr:glycosyltransferase [Pseudochryseolinea flava]RAV99867.1 glycosyltransferase [Pseudochryseolinea flava]
MNHPKYSIVIPVYNRPQEIEELLESLRHQTYRNFEVVVVEDGSSIRCDTVVDRYRDAFPLHYFYKPNTGPGPSRNFGYAKANGDYLVVFDSDCIIPPGYFDAVEKSMTVHQWDAWGGPDQAHENFTLLQRAMGYTMASFFTTGGIRGGKKHIGWFQPRSFNMGISKKVFQETQGFKFDRFAEDIEFSIRMRKAGFKVGLITDAFVYHKRRTTFAQFYNQVSNFGKGRALVGKSHPEEVKPTHWFPSVFVLGTCSLLVLPFIHTGFSAIATTLWLLYFLLIGVDALRVSGNVAVAMLSIPSAFLQLWGYGIGFLKARFS